MLRFANKLEALVRIIGRVTATFTFVMVALTCVIVVERYWFKAGSISLQESVTFLHAALFMLAAAYTLAAGDHVRVDIFYGSMSPQKKAMVDLAGTLLLLFPFCGFLVWSSWDYVSISWQIREASQETGGLPFPFPAITKSFIPLMAILLIVQGVVILLRSSATLWAEDTSATPEAD
ncbi:MAG: TRAP transporter small permease subunit [Gammaproteobacteria bacterium]|jgi:TRAP-type mannitol/chloroaromatic compound transport system permease small subunit|nr:TRAP transporter small permease subunit [Gammaproteobacteria bacterium]MDP6616838.1 TRAP transporter small permease subunit [Gammaproteobacteria bacterium]MDP6694602.1 TRAP transporter small permease subunit [Gammaproteobacteria bacterium]